MDVLIKGVEVELLRCGAVGSANPSSKEYCPSECSVRSVFNAFKLLLGAAKIHPGEDAYSFDRVLNIAFNSFKIAFTRDRVL